MRDQVAAILPSIAGGQFRPPSSPYRVLVQGQVVEIPRRVYYEADRIRESARQGGVAGCIALCLGAAHHDGFVRQECAEQLLPSAQPWIAPFIVKLVGEYVIEIISAIERALPLMNAKMYGEFLSANPEWFETIRRRVVSYWDAYYRSTCPKLDAYPGSRVVAQLQMFAERSKPSLGDMPRQTQSSPSIDETASLFAHPVKRSA